MDPSGTREFLFQVTAALALFLAARTYFAPRPSARRRLAVVIAAFAAAEALYGITQWLSETPEVLWVVKQFYAGAATGTLIGRTHFAVLLYLGLGCALALLVTQLQRTPRQGDDRGREVATRVTLALAAGLMLGGILASKSRAGLAGAALVLAYSIALALRRGRRAVALVSLAILTLAAIPTMLLVAPDISERLSNLPYEWTGAVSRGAVLRLSPELIQAFPLFGAGAGTFELVFTRLRTSGITGLYDHAHNDYLEILIECGLIGLALALAPVALYVDGIVRDWRRRRSAGLDRMAPYDLELIPWPIFAALGVVALHELVDFALQIPALAFLVALLAGAFGRPPRKAGPARGALAVGIVALALALPAVAHSAARWPGIQDAASFPDLPDVRANRARQAFNLWQQNKKNAELIQRALSDQARAQTLRPLFARYALSHVQYIAGALGAQAAAPNAEDLLRDDIRRLSHNARTLDPWNGWNRSRLIESALFLGDLDQAVEDARIATGQNPSLTQDIIEKLLKIGLPTSALPRIVGQTPNTFGVLLGTLLEHKDLESAGKLVPPHPQPDLLFCQNGWAVREVLKDAHHAPAERFLLGCLELPEVKRTEEFDDLVKSWLVMDLLDRNEVTRAESWVQRMRPGAMRWGMELDLAERRADWKEAIRCAREILDGAEPLDSPEVEGWTRFRLGRAYAQSGRLDLALGEFRKIQRLEVDLGDIDGIIRTLELGENPFR